MTAGSTGLVFCLLVLAGWVAHQPAWTLMLGQLVDSWPVLVLTLGTPAAA